MKRIVFFVGFGIEKDGHRGICGPEKRFLQTCQIMHGHTVLPIVIYPVCGRLFDDFQQLSKKQQIILISYSPENRRDYVKVVYQTIKRYSPHAIHCQGSLLFDLIASVLGRLMHVKTIITRPVTISQDHLTPIRKMLSYAADQIIARNANALIAISNTHKDQWKKELSPLMSSSEMKKLKVIYNGIFLNHASPLLDKPVAPPVIFTICAQLTPVKGHDLLLRAVYQLHKDGKPLLLNILGDGPLKAYLASICSQLGIEKMVRFHGHQSNVDSVFQDTHVVVLPSLREGLSLALLEAMAMSCPLIASNVGATHELIDNGINGFLVQKNNVSDIYLAMKWFLDYPSTIKQMGKQSLGKVKKFDIFRMIDSYQRLYIDI